MTSCYDLTLRYIQILADIDRCIEKKSKVSHIDDHNLLDAEINRLEIEMFEIKNRLKSKEL